MRRGEARWAVDVVCIIENVSLIRNKGDICHRILTQKMMYICLASRRMFKVSVLPILRSSLLKAAGLPSVLSMSWQIRVRCHSQQQTWRPNLGAWLYVSSLMRTPHGNCEDQKVFGRTTTILYSCQYIPNVLCFLSQSTIGH